MTKYEIINVPLDQTRVSPSVIELAVGPNWLNGFIQRMGELRGLKIEGAILSLSGVSFVNLKEWTIAVAYIDDLMDQPQFRHFYCDLVGDYRASLLSPEDLINFTKKIRTARMVTQEEYDASERIYRVSGFLESLRTYDILNRPGRRSHFGYQFLGEDAAVFGFYVGTEWAPTVDLPYQHISERAHCRQFLDLKLINEWRTHMHARFASSPLFQNEELWRIFCHELAVNIWEHAGGSGFMVARVVELFDSAGQRVRSIWRRAFANIDATLLEKMKPGFVELCISDMGPGFPPRLREVFAQVTGKKLDTISDVDVLSFAFGIHGTSKPKEQRWATERHALSRILHLVAKYGGVLTLRSGKGEVVYASNGGPFRRLPDFQGRAPTQSSDDRPQIVGSHLQLILPLIPLLADRIETFSRAQESLPPSFRIQPEHVRGHLV